MSKPRRQRSKEAQQYRRLYKTPEWKLLRAHQLAKEPWCRMCKAKGRMTLATVVDHIISHKGDRKLFFDPGNVQSLCASHHNSEKQSEERLGYSKEIGADGYPIDPRHPVNRYRAAA